MIHLIGKENKKGFPPNLKYTKGRVLLGKIVLPLTRYLRYVNVKKHINGGERLLDIGCGDGFFIKHINCKERYGLDKLLGDNLTNTLNFPDEYFDYVTMLAVIEHIENPELLIREIHRVLKPHSKFIFTTPKKEAEKFIKIYAAEDTHKTYFNYEEAEKITNGIFKIINFNYFFFGLNQIFVLEKIIPPSE